MKEKDLVPGKVYRLTCDVKNPSPDRRGENFRRGRPATYLWAEKWAVWPKGMRFRYVVENIAADDDDHRVEAKRIENFDGDMHGSIQQTVWAADSSTKVLSRKWTELVYAFEPEPESFDTVMCEIFDDSRAGAGLARDLLRVLWGSKAITTEQIKDALTQYRAEDETP